MKHHIRQKIINEYGLPVVKVETINGELGSRVLDKNGIEIFEGDLVKEVGTVDETVSTIKFNHGGFTLDDSVCLDAFGDGELEVIGHAED